MRPAGDVLVTGLGATTPLGGDVAETWRGMLTGRSGVRRLEAAWAAEVPVRIAAPVACDPDLGPVAARRLDRSQRLALVAAREAWADAGAPAVDPARLAVVVASGIGGVLTLLGQYDVMRQRGAERVSPFGIPMLMPNGPAAAVGLELGAQAGVHTPVSACASGAEAIAWGLDIIRTDRADVVVCGGVEAAIHPLPIAGFAAMRALSTRSGDPAAASRPFDSGRDGFVMGEGAGILVLESASHAAARGVAGYAVLAGRGLSSDAHHMAAPDPSGSGAGRAIVAALRDADADASEVVHVNAHATSTPLGDLAEARALRSALGVAADQVAVSATKSMTGHLLGAAGAVEAIAAVLAVHAGCAPPTRNLDDLDDEVDLPVVRGRRQALPHGLALSDSFGFGGHNIILAFRATSGARVAS